MISKSFQVGGYSPRHVSKMTWRLWAVQRNLRVGRTVSLIPQIIRKGLSIVMDENNKHEAPTENHVLSIPFLQMKCFWFILRSPHIHKVPREKDRRKYIKNTVESRRIWMADVQLNILTI